MRPNLFLLMLKGAYPLIHINRELLRISVRWVDFLSKGEPYVDSDGDGMPDAWELANGLNPNDPSDAVKDCNGDGYTNIEKYINGMDTKTKVDWTDLKNNYDTLSKRKSLL